MTDDNIHWFSIINSFVIVVFLTGIVALIMLRILRKDFARYNELALSEVNPNLLFLYRVFLSSLTKNYIKDFARYNKLALPEVNPNSLFFGYEVHLNVLALLVPMYKY